MKNPHRDALVYLAEYYETLLPHVAPALAPLVDSAVCRIHAALAEADKKADGRTELIFPAPGKPIEHTGVGCED